MSYEPYPSGPYQQYPAGGPQSAGRPPQPRSVRTASWLMYAGAVLAALNVILALVLSRRIKNSIITASLKANATARSQGKTTLTLSQIHTLANAFVAGIIVVGLISILIWVWMAWANGRGKNWARIVASVLFGLDTLLILLSITRAGASALFSLVTWLVGLAAIILIWRRESSEYFKPGTMQPRG
jgi:hypothetical protein